jgi:chromosome segregation ATPase
MAELESRDLDYLAVRLEKMNVNEVRLEAKIEASEEKIEANEENLEANEEKIEANKKKIEANEEKIEANQENIKSKVQADQEMTKATVSASQNNIQTGHDVVIAQINSSQEETRDSKNIMKFTQAVSKESISTWMEGFLASVDRWKESLHEEISCKLRYVESVIENTSRELKMHLTETRALSCRRGSQRTEICVYRARLPLQRRWARSAYNRRERQVCLECGGVGHLRRHCRWGYFQKHFPEK